MRAAAVSLLLAACTPAPRPPAAGPAPIPGDASAVYAHYIETLPRSFKMRHQVASRFGDREDVISGYLIGERPDRFWVRAAGPMGVTLFDVKSTGGSDLRVDAKLDQITDPNAPRYLANDIRRIYFAECPAGTAARREDDLVVAACDLPAPADPDDHLVTSLSPGGIVLKKCFYKDRAPTVCVDYEDYAETAGTWLARRVHLQAMAFPYELTIALERAELGIDTKGAFGQP
jgi:hypothetical protein